MPVPEFGVIWGCGVPLFVQTKPPETTCAQSIDVHPLVEPELFIVQPAGGVFVVAVTLNPSEKTTWAFALFKPHSNRNKLSKLLIVMGRGILYYIWQ